MHSRWFGITFLVVLVMSVLSSCLRYAPMTMVQKDVAGEPFRLDGYYFTKAPGKEISRNDTVVTTLVFYSNGFFFSRSFSSSHLKAVDSLLSAKKGPSLFLEGAGYYQVVADSIWMEYWTNVSHFPVPTAKAKGKILNDSTLRSNILGNDDRLVWRFRSLASKPDSTTVFDEQLKKGVPIRRTKRQGGFGES